MPGTGAVPAARPVMISVVVPVLNEAAMIGPAVETLLQQSGQYEILVVDGGSDDGTCDVVRRFPVRLVHRPPAAPAGIGSQINAGAREARGDILLFLHVDVQLPPQGIRRVETAMANARIAGGGFIPAFCGPVPDSERLLLAFVERAWQMRTRARRWFAGDTAPFVRTGAFWRAGGYPLGFACDWDFAGRLRRLGPLAVIDDPVRVSSRRHTGNGVLKTLLVTGSVELMYRLGVRRAVLHAWYRRSLPRERDAAS